MGYNLISPPLYVFPTWSVTNHRCHVCRGLRSQLNNDFVKPIAKHWPSKILTNYMLNFPFAPFVKQRASKWTCSNWRWYFSITWPPKRVRLTQRFWTGLRNCSQHSCDIYPPASIILQGNIRVATLDSIWSSQPPRLQNRKRIGVGIWGYQNRPFKTLCRNKLEIII